MDQNSCVCKEEVMQIKAFEAPTAQKPLLLCFNENPFGMSRKAKEAAGRALEAASRYPFIRNEALREACARFMGGKPENIMMTYGSAEAIRASIEAYLGENPQVVVPELSYSDGESCALRNGLAPVKIPMGPDWSVDIDAMKKAVQEFEGSSVVYLANPSNPTSTITDSVKLNDWIRSKPANTLFVIDEAYAEFVDDPSFVSAKTLVDEGLDNLVVTKTFSKIFALAGLRVGFAYAVPSVIEKVRRRVAYDIMMPIAAIEAALAEIDDQEFFEISRVENRVARKILTDCLDELGIEYLPSQTNFVFVNLKAALEPFADRMRAEHILVGRAFPPALEWCRISVGTVDEMKWFAKTMKEFRAKGWV